MLQSLSSFLFPFSASHAPPTALEAASSAQTVKLTTFGLGSTLGLVLLTCITLSGRSTVNSGFLTSFDSTVKSLLDYGVRVMGSTRALTTRVGLAKTRRLLDIVARDYVVVALTFPIHMVRAIAEESQRMDKDYRARYGEPTWRNFCKLLRIVKVWEPLPYYLKAGRTPSALARPMIDKTKYGLVGVCLRFRMGSERERIERQYDETWPLHSRALSIPAYLPLEKDGSLRVDVIREKFHIEEVELLIPDRYEIIRVSSGDRISPILLHQLIEKWHCVNVVEHEDIYCRKRRRFRQWLLSTRLHYFCRVACYFLTLFVIAAACAVPAYHAELLFPSKLWWCFCHSIGLSVGFIAWARFIEYRGNKHGQDSPWVFPKRYSAYWLDDRAKGPYL